MQYYLLFKEDILLGQSKYIFSENGVHLNICIMVVMSEKHRDGMLIINLSPTFLSP